MRRRDFIASLGGAVAMPFTGRAQQAMPVVGFVYTASADAVAPRVVAFHQGLSEIGFIEGRNVAVEYRWPGSEREKLRALVDELVHRQVAVIVANTLPAMAAKSATSTIPIVFASGADPVKLGLVASFNRPGGNATGAIFLSIGLEAKRLGFLQDLLPGARSIAALVDPNAPDSAAQLENVQEAARMVGRQVHVVQAGTEGQLDDALATLARQRPDALLVAPAPFFASQRKQLVDFTARHALPTIYGQRDFPLAGGLMSYGTNIADAFRQVGIYAGRILKGEKPADLPVMQPTKFELVINTTTAKVLGLQIPPTLLALADEVIE